jgi:hypothetical protein
MTMGSILPPFVVILSDGDIRQMPFLGSTSIIVQTCSGCDSCQRSDVSEDEEEVAGPNDSSGADDGSGEITVASEVEEVVAEPSEKSGSCKGNVGRVSSLLLGCRGRGFVGMWPL